MGLSRISHYIYGKEIRVIGKNREILTAAKAARVQ